MALAKWKAAPAALLRTECAHVRMCVNGDVRRNRAAPPEYGTYPYIMDKAAMGAGHGGRWGPKRAYVRECMRGLCGGIAMEAALPGFYHAPGRFVNVDL